MAADTRIYIVTDNQAPAKPRLVRAATPAAALRHVTTGRFATAVASQDDLVNVLLSADNIGVESAKAEPDPPNN